MSRTYAVPDLHGRYDLLNAAIDIIRDHSVAVKIVTLADYVDRGPDSCRVIERYRGGASQLSPPSAFSPS
jgi:serine/threonine protein phosphatase 1